MAKRSYGKRKGGYSRPARRTGRSYGGGYSRPAPRRSVSRSYSGRPQRVEVILRHVGVTGNMNDPGYLPGVPGTVGIANVPATKKGKTF